MLRRHFLRGCVLSAAGVALPMRDALGAFGRPQVPQTPAAGTSQTGADPAQAARLAALGKRNVGVHDPSTIVKAANGEYWIFRTGTGVPSLRSKDLVTWE